ncbi:hypothetical protein KKA95_02750, partial [Patescibacteria group bacterium]|nr:hypothetical protein [Patescibacteria group bacterium]
MTIAPILLVLLSVLFTIKPVRIMGFKLDMVRAPILAIVLLAMLGQIDFPLLKEAIIGVGTLEPWKIIVLFFSMAYVSLSVDVTGLFDW